MKRSFFLNAIAATVAGCAVFPCLARPGDTCAPVHAAYSKMLSSHTQQTMTKSGTVSVTAAFGQIVDDGSYTDTCTFVREEQFDGQAAAVYSERMASKAGVADGMVWISKDTGATLRYQQYDDGTGPYLLRYPLDPDLERIESKAAQFKAHRSLRDVEPACNLRLIELNGNVIDPEEDLE